MKTKNTEVKLIENKTENYYRVTINGKDAYSPFTWVENMNDENNQMNMRRLAKACAFDEIMNLIRDQKPFTIDYYSH